MSQETSPATGKRYGLKRICDALGVARSSIYSKREVTCSNIVLKRPGPQGMVPETDLLQQIREDIEASPFKGEGHRKIHARIRRKGIPVGKNRILRLMKQHQLLSPHRNRSQSKRPHDGKIITLAPNEMWCSDGLKIQTVKDGWVWIFSVEEHWNAECLGWHVCKHGNRFAAFEAIAQAIKGVYGSCSKEIARGLKLRIDNGCQYTSDYFLKQLKYLGIEESFGLIRQPQTNGVAERFNRTLKEQIVNGRIYQDIEELREAVRQFVGLYNNHWLIAKLGYQSPLETRRNYQKLREVA